MPMFHNCVYSHVSLNSPLKMRRAMITSGSCPIKRKMQPFRDKEVSFHWICVQLRRCFFKQGVADWLPEYLQFDDIVRLIKWLGKVDNCVRYVTHFFFMYVANIYKSAIQLCVCMRCGALHWDMTWAHMHDVEWGLMSVKSLLIFWQIQLQFVSTYYTNLTYLKHVHVL